MASWNDEELVAYHEAGHAVVAYVLGRRPRRASIVGGETSRGYVLLQMGAALQRRLRDELAAERDRRPIETYVMACYAGAGALTILGAPQPSEGAEDDLDKAWKILGRLAPEGDERKAYGDWLRERSLNLLRAHWGAVCAVAAELTVRRDLCSPMLEALIEEHLREHIETGSS